MGFADRHVGDIAASLPGATQVLRAHNIDYCCGGERSLAAAAAAQGQSLAEIEGKLAALAPAGAAAPQPTDELIDHILTRFHETHRRELPELIALADKVEQRHAAHPAVPRGLADALRETAAALDEHMQKEEQVLFPLMRSGGHPMIGAPISCMRGEHVMHGERLDHLEALAGGLALPVEACATWGALYAGLRKLIDDVHEHVHLENNVLFPRFGA
jgi:regulator of cell morphogenesis and NO signaling